MSKVALNMPAPLFSLKDFKGNPVALSDWTGKFNILLVFNRGFT
jgi:peroxiredoxin